MKKTLLIFSFLFSLFVMNTTASYAQQSMFNDVSKDHWAIEEIEFLSSLDVIKGYNDGNFGPEDKIKRAQAAIMVVRALKLDIDNRPDPGFKDLDNNHYAYKEIATVVDEEIFPKTDYFKPNEELTRGDMAKLLVKSYDLTGRVNIEFEDIDYSNDLYSFVNTLYANRITTGYSDNTYKPQNSVTRAQFSVFFARILNEQFKPSVINENFLELASGGVLVGCNYSLENDVTAKEIVNDNGDPEWEGFYDGGYGRLYNGCVYYEDGFESEGLIQTIDIDGQLFNMSPEDIKTIIGDPDSEGFDDMTGEYYQKYLAGNYILTIYFEDSQSIARAARLKLIP
ncbi:S-layer homology domain-containing protein [Bacillus sp. SM2101]|uniref:S-layer homology domain-containing protein n=1 Tax=Bacillus sp. SM2101 TaxID=2805366 RepID=UPI001BDEF275|nr:S-layer homology domain-containing protein [Bacillus sp. SM2101]